MIEVICFENNVSLILDRINFRKIYKRNVMRYIYFSEIETKPAIRKLKISIYVNVYFM